MNFYINQSIQINYLRVEGISNSSVLQIGSAGSIKTLSNLYNTGSYTEAAPPVAGGGAFQDAFEEGPSSTFVPLIAPSVTTG
ncbi:spore germination protein GerPB [Bacillus paralicheniformis]|jgi:spore germination protein PB|uniref:Protein GerPB required for proper assembly of spore coat mutations lead to super-dormant spore n=1 Tax=Bacillus paralicheniformis TaxID=1648923 RepID=A0A6I7TLG8_9BACI|nr:MULTISPECIES: spore germination protein GerPB [Bacillus]ETB70856.1 spore germination protein gerPB [Bacillus sp. CPSM8]KJD55145.1 spore gernimation protein GerPB [Bacillus amyloliquefaciens]KUL09737.1 spore germination protein gerPB [Bacillus licheniformis LMG 7559]KUL17330.1 spore germination protein gerPB [Bacillus licheniformis LMG 6934]POO83417.1 spore gernimation protein GerPB [Bacillus sp. MBGLi97]